MVPDGGGELATLIESDLSRHAKTCQPSCNESIRTLGRLHVFQQHHLNPARHVVDHSEEVLAAIMCHEERVHQIHVHMQEALAWHRDWLDSSSRLFSYLGMCTILAISSPGQEILVHALQDHTCRHEKQL